MVKNVDNVARNRPKYMGRCAAALQELVYAIYFVNNPDSVEYRRAPSDRIEAAERLIERRLRGSYVDLSDIVEDARRIYIGA